MKRTTIIWLIVIAYAICGIALYHVTESYIYKKSFRLRTEAFNNLEHFFGGKDKIVTVGYSRKDIKYRKIRIPEYNENNQYEDKQTWEDRWGDIYELYALQPRFESEENPDNQWSGWLLNVVEKVSSNTVELYKVFPFQMGYRRHENSWMFAVETAINTAFDFYTNNEKSQFYDYMVPGKDVWIDDLRSAVENEYFRFICYEDYVNSAGEEVADVIAMMESLYKVKDQYSGIFGHMYNDYYKVYTYIAPVAFYKLDDNINAQNADKKRILLWGYAILTFLFLAAITPLSVVEARKRKERSLSLKDKLLRECNPARFMKPYDGAKVATANELYESIVAIPEDNIDDLKAMRKRVSEELGVSFIDRDLIKELISISTPQKYTNPYDPEKVRIANSIYNRLISEDLDVDEIEELQKEINEKLLNDNH